MPSLRPAPRHLSPLVTSNCLRIRPCFYCIVTTLMSAFQCQCPVHVRMCRAIRPWLLSSLCVIFLSVAHWLLPLVFAHAEWSAAVVCGRSAHFIDGKYRYIENFSSHADDVSIKVWVTLISFSAFVYVTYLLCSSISKVCFWGTISAWWTSERRSDNRKSHVLMKKCWQMSLLSDIEAVSDCQLVLCLCADSELTNDSDLWTKCPLKH